MVFASSKDALRRSLVGIAVEIQGTDFSEVAYETGASPVQSRPSRAYRRAVLEKASRGA
jgi:hypothetical protein